MQGKNVVIIGGGISGMTTGIYLLKNGYSVEILEKNGMPGGACVGWERQGCYIDGCIHWLVGTNEGSPYYEMWHDIHALEEDTQIYFQDDFSVFEFADGKKLTMWADIDRFENELIGIAPEDEKEIKRFCKYIRRFRKIEGPIDKPVDLMGLFQLLQIGFTMAGEYYWANKFSKIDCEEYGIKHFKSKYIRYFFANFMAPKYNVMSMLYMLAHVMNHDGGIPIGGSKAMSERIANYYRKLGGSFRLGATVKKVLIEDDRAVGVELANGSTINADWVVSSVAAEHCLKDLLGDKYKVKKMETRYADTKTYPIYTMTIAVLKSTADLSNYPLGLHAIMDKNVYLDKGYDGYALRNYSYDKTLKTPEGSSIMQVQIVGDDDMYYWWKEQKNNGTYKAEKARVAEELIKIISERYPDLDGKLEAIDVITPCTYERYLNTRHGSFQGFVHTAKGKALMQKGVIDGLKGFILSGQCIFQSGGLPPAVITGKFAAQRICKADHVKFQTAGNSVANSVKKRFPQKQTIM